MTENTIQLPGNRDTVLYNIYLLSNKDYQMREWVNSDFNNHFGYQIGEIITDFDDVGLEPPLDLKDAVGVILYNEEEIEPLEEAVKAFNVVFEKFDTDQPDEVYYTSPLWNEVVRTAKHALEVMVKYEPPGTSFKKNILKEPVVQE
jgi:hypothetical protein